MIIIKSNSDKSCLCLTGCGHIESLEHIYYCDNIGNNQTINDYSHIYSEVVCDISNVYEILPNTLINRIRL